MAHPDEKPAAPPTGPSAPAATEDEPRVTTHLGESPRGPEEAQVRNAEQEAERRRSKGQHRAEPVSGERS